MRADGDEGKYLLVRIIMIAKQVLLAKRLVFVHSKACQISFLEIADLWIFHNQMNNIIQSLLLVRMHLLHRPRKAVGLDDFQSNEYSLV